MQQNQLATAQFLDILFEGRNKSYGAYQLRLQYHKRLRTALIATLMLIAGLVLLLYLNKGNAQSSITISDIPSMKLTEVEMPPIIELPPPPPPRPAASPVNIATRIYVTPIIVEDANVRPDEVPPKNLDLQDVKIGLVNKDGDKDDGLPTQMNASGDGGRGVVVGIPPKENDDAPFEKVEIESTYPGGSTAWARFLNRNLRFPDRAIEDGNQGTVIIQFIVDKEGNVSDVIALNNPGGGLAEEAVRIIKKSGKWKPAIQNGQHVKSYKKQPITFKINHD